MSTFEHFAAAMDVIHDAGGRVYFLEPAPGEPWVRGSARDLATLDYTEADFDRFDWGESVVIGDRVFREAISLDARGGGGH